MSNRYLLVKLNIILFITVSTSNTPFIWKQQNFLKYSSYLSYAFIWFLLWNIDFMSLYWLTQQKQRSNVRSKMKKIHKVLVTRKLFSILQFYEIKINSSQNENKNYCTFCKLFFLDVLLSLFHYQEFLHNFFPFSFEQQQTF